VGDRPQFPPAQPLHRREPARAGRRRARSHGPRAPDRRPLRQPAAERGALGPAVDRGRHAAHAEQRREKRLLHLPAGEQGRAPDARGGRSDPRRADLHGRPGLRRPRLPGARLLRPGRSSRRRLRHLPEVARAGGPRPVAHLHPGRPAPRRSARPDLHHKRQPRRPRAGQRGRHRPVRGHRDRLLQGRAEHLDAADRNAAGPQPALLTRDRLRGPSRRRPGTSWIACS
jgi:hypothetical protein